jgi:cysteine desulfurase
MKTPQKIVYMDNNATTQVAPEVVEAMEPFFLGQYGNPSSIHRFGGGVRRHIDRAREQVAALLGAEPSDVFFTSCGTESDNMALQGFRAAHGSPTTVVTSTVEHPAVQNVAHQFRKEGVQVVEAEVDGNGNLDLNAISSLDIDEHTLFSFMWANNETGVDFPIAELADMVHAKGGLFHTDAVQAVGKVPVDVRNTAVDMLALSGHKLHAPKGVGALYVRKGVTLPPLMYGGHQEEGVRPGTENVPYIVGLGRACELALASLDEEMSRVKSLRDRLEHELLERCPGAKLNGDPKRRMPNTTNISFEFIEGEAILLHLDEKGIAASSGSACTTGSLEPSHVMRAMGVPYTLAHSSIRLSLSRYTTDEDVDTVIRELPTIVERLRSISPFVASQQ